MNKSGLGLAVITLLFGFGMIEVRASGLDAPRAAQIIAALDGGTQHKINLIVG